MILEARGILGTDKIEMVIKRVKDVFNVFLGKMYMNDISEIRCAASLTHYGLLNGMVTMGMENVDLSSVPDEQLVSLTASVSRALFIENVSGCDLLSILTSLKCDQVIITNQSLGREETRALVRLMEEERGISRGLHGLYLGDEVTLDIEALVEYSGQGWCKEIMLDNKTLARYSEELRTWAKSRNWGEGEFLAPLMEDQTVLKRLD